MARVPSGRRAHDDVRDSIPQSPGGLLSAIPLIRAAALSPYFEGLDSISVPVEALLDAVRLPRAGELRPDVAIPYQQVLDFIAVTARALGAETLPAAIARKANLDHLGSWGRLLGRSKTLGEFLQTVTETSWMHTNGARWWLADAGADVLLCNRLDRRLDLGRGDALALWLGFAIDPIRRTLGADFVPAEVTVVRPLPIPLDSLGIPLRARVAGMNSIRIPRSALGAATASWRRLVCGSEDLLGQLRNTAPAGEFVESVRQALRPLCAGARIDLESFAEAARMRPRTLQRRLGESGATFSGIVQEVQFARAIEMMSRTDVKLIDVALELGFSDPAHFTRAFRRWSGRAPREFRGTLDGRAHLES